MKFGLLSLLCDFLFFLFFFFSKWSLQVMSYSLTISFLIFLIFIKKELNEQTCLMSWKYKKKINTFYPINKIFKEDSQLLLYHANNGMYRDKYESLRIPFGRTCPWICFSWFSQNFPVHGPHFELEKLVVFMIHSVSPNLI